MRLTGVCRRKQPIERPNKADAIQTRQPSLQLLREIATDARSYHIRRIVINKNPTVLLSRIRSLWGKNIICDQQRSPSFSNIFFTEGDIVLYNGELNVWDSVFDNSGIFLMRLNLFMENFLLAQKVKPLQFNHFQTADDDSANIMQTSHSMCLDVTLKLIKVKWEYEPFDFHKATPLDVPSRQGI